MNTQQTTNTEMQSESLIQPVERDEIRNCSEYLENSMEENVGETPSKRKKCEKDKKKRDTEFDKKQKVARAVSKHQNLYEISHQKYMDKNMEAASWKNVSNETGLPVDECVKFWNSLKRSARYYARIPKIPCKSGAAASSLEKKYREEWPHADCMAFYTPSTLKVPEKLVTICNTVETASSASNEPESQNYQLIDDIWDLPVSYEDDEGAPIYVRFSLTSNKNLEMQMKN